MWSRSERPGGDGRLHLSLLTELDELVYYLLIALKMRSRHLACHSYRVIVEGQHATAHAVGY